MNSLVALDTKELGEVKGGCCCCIGRRTLPAYYYPAYAYGYGYGYSYGYGYGGYYYW
jgi:hypothetical protein